MRDSNLPPKWVLCASLIASLLLTCCVVYGQTEITVTGGTWADVQNADDLQGGAGSDLWATSTSAVAAVEIAVVAAGNWHIDVRRDDTSWHASLELWCHRIVGGAGTVSGGLTYQEITTSYVAFFTGNGNASELPIQFQVRGISIEIPVGGYSTTITFTLTDDL